MNKRQVVVLWIVALVLATATYFTWSSKSTGFESKTERSRGQTVLADFTTDQVAKIKVSSGETSTTLLRKDGKWTVEDREGYPAKTAAVNDFLRTLAEVKVVDGIEANPSYAPRFGMDPNSSKPEERGTEVIFSNDAGTELGHITLGKNLQAASEDPMAAMMGGGAGSVGRFLRNHSDETGVYKVSEMFSALTPDPKTWLDPEFVKIDKIKSISVSTKGAPDKVAWKVTRANEDGEFTVDAPQEGETIDTTAAGSLKSLLSYASFEDVVPADKAAAAKPEEKRTAKIETFEGFVYTITVSPAEAEKPKEGDPEAPAPEEAYLMTVNVEGTVPAERKKEDKESAEDAKAKDDAFAKRKEELEKRLADGKAIAGKTYKVTKSTVEFLIKERSEIAPKQAPGGAANATPAPGGQPGMPPGFPGGSAVSPPVQVPPAPPRRKPVEAVTPPIAIPPLEEGEKAPKEDKPAEDKPAEEKKDQ